jgi:cytochrome bd ubiquinol oxidase subunit II
VTPELAVAGVMLAALVLYTLTGAADFGGGVWELLASGPRADDQRRLIDRTLAPIWEANHVWLILVVVLLFVCFPAAFAVVSTALHVPLTVMLIGIVLRGSAFTFRAYDPRPGPGARRWRRVFEVASLVTPVTLGVTLGAVTMGIRVDPATGLARTDFVSEWLAPFPFAVGAFTLCLCAYLAAVYLAHEADDPGLSDMFRRRALVSAALVGAAALAAFLASAPAAPHLYAGVWTWPLQLATGLAALAAIALLWRRRYLAARVAAAGQVGLIVLGWGLAQYPYLVVPDLTIAGSAAPRSVLVPVLVALGLGALVLVPALVWLFSVFRAHTGGADDDH